jgi:hypothetical protein
MAHAADHPLSTKYRPTKIRPCIEGIIELIRQNCPSPSRKPDAKRVRGHEYLIDGSVGSMPKAVIFDVDGTLVDSVDLHAHAWVDAFRDFGHQVDFKANASADRQRWG